MSRFFIADLSILCEHYLKIIFWFSLIFFRVQLGKDRRCTCLSQRDVRIICLINWLGIINFSYLIEVSNQFSWLMKTKKFYSSLSSITCSLLSRTVQEKFTSQQHKYRSIYQREESLETFKNNNNNNNNNNRLNVTKVEKIMYLM